MAKIGIDFGTSFTTMSYVDNNGKATPIQVLGKEKVPSMLYFSDDGEVLYGEAAYNKYIDCKDAENQEQADRILGGIVTGLKHDMSRNGNIATPQGNKTYSEVISMFFRYLKEYAEKYVFNGETVTDVCLTYPVSFDLQPEKKGMLKDAAVQAGFIAQNIRLLKEPVAALMGYENSNNVKNQGVLVYDFGGGTFDAYYVMFDYNGVEHSMAPVGDGDCGGQNIDQALYDFYDKKVYALKNRHISTYDNDVFLPVLKKDCVEQKEQMSKGIFSNAYLILPPASSDFVKVNALSQLEWNDIIGPWVDRTIVKVKLLLRQIEDHNAEEGAMHFGVDKVLLIGGSSRFPQVYERLKEVCPVSPTHVQDVDVEVSKGAAVYINADAVRPERCFCIYCGYEMQTDNRFCAICGKPNFRYNRCFDDL